MTVGPLTLEQPLEIDDARRAARRLADQRRQAEQDLERQVEKAADASRSAKKSYALAFVAAEGTAAERQAIAKDKAGEAERDADIQAGLVRVLTERLRGLEGERSMLKSLTEWSMRMALDEHERRAGQVHHPAHGKRAA